MKPIPEITAAAALSPKEEAELGRAEHAIEKAERGFRDFGEGLTKIHAGKLYRPRNWERYCLDRWELSHDRARQLMDAAEAIGQLKHDNCRALPARESHVRPLLALEPAARPGAWRRALEIAGKRRMLADHVERAVEEIIGKPSSAGPGESSVADMLAFDALPAGAKREAIERSEADARRRSEPGARSPRTVGGDQHGERTGQLRRLLERARRLAEGYGGDEPAGVLRGIDDALAALDGLADAARAA